MIFHRGLIRHQQKSTTNPGHWCFLDTRPPLHSPRSNMFLQTEPQQPEKQNLTVLGSMSQDNWATYKTRLVWLVDRISNSKQELYSIKYPNNSSIRVFPVTFKNYFDIYIYIFFKKKGPSKLSLSSTTTLYCNPLAHALKNARIPPPHACCSAI